MKRGTAISALVLTGIMAMGSVFGGCGNKESVPEEKAARQESVKEENDEQLVVATAKDIGDLSPHGYCPMYAQDFVYEGLTAFENGEVKPCLAENWDISEDGKEYTFYLRKDVKFTDGSPLSAEVVKMNFDAVMMHKEDHSFLESINLMNEVTVIDEHTVKITYDEAYYPILQELSLSRPVRIMAKASFPEDGDTGNGIKEPIGTGMWKLKEHVEEQYAVFERNEDYWGEKPKFKEVKVVVTPDGDTSVNALKAGEVDMIFDIESRLSPDAFKELESSGFAGHVSEPLSTVSLILNSNYGPTEDLKVRQALNYGVNKEIISENVFYGLQQPADTFFDKAVPYCDVELNKYDYDKEKAEKLLEEAGWKMESGEKYRTKDGKELEMGFYFDGENVIYKTLGEVLQSEWEKIGIKLNLEAMERQVLIDQQKSGEFDITITETWGDPYDPHTLVAYMANEEYADYQAQKGLPMKEELDEKIHQVIVETDEEKRQELYNYILTTIHEQAAYLPISNTTRLVVCEPDITGVKFDSLYYMPLEDVERK